MMQRIVGLRLLMLKPQAALNACKYFDANLVTPLNPLHFKLKPCSFLLRSFGSPVYRRYSNISSWPTFRGSLVSWKIGWDIRDHLYFMTSNRLWLNPEKLNWYGYQELTFYENVKTVCWTSLYLLCQICTTCHSCAKTASTLTYCMHLGGLL